MKVSNARNLVWVTLASVLLMSGLFLCLDVARAEHLSSGGGHVLAAPKAANTPQATTLTLSIPDLVIGSGGYTKTLDLWGYTNYDGDKADLVFTATHTTYNTNNAYLAYEIINGHFLSMTTTTPLNGKTVGMLVEASDGALSDSTEFVVAIEQLPELDLSPLDDPLVIQAGNALADPIDLWDYVDDDDYNYDLVFTIANTLPMSLGLVLDDHTIYISPTQGFSATVPVEVMVEDTVGLTDSDVLNVWSITSTIDITMPDLVVLEVNGEPSTWDLMDYTIYEGTRELTFTAQTKNTYDQLEVGVISHTLVITPVDFSTSYEVIVEVTDGYISDLDTFAVLVNHPPELNFYDPPSFVDPLDDPLVVDYREGLDPLIDLWDYADDFEFSDENLTFTLASTGTMMVNFGVTISGGRYIDVNPKPGVYGTYPVRVRVEDPTKLMGSDVFTLTVVQDFFLPTIVRNYRPIPQLLPMERIDDFYGNDGHYRIEWLYHESDYETEFSFNDPTFTNAQRARVYDRNYDSGFFTWPGTHYWRVRAVQYSDGEWVPISKWSNVQSTSVGRYAYLYVIKESYAFDMTVQVTGNGVNAAVHADSRAEGYWRSIPVGTYSFRITNQLCAPDTRTQSKTLQNTVETGAWYVIDTCEPIAGPFTSLSEY